MAFQTKKEKVNYFNEEKQRKSQPDSRLRNTVTMDLSDNYLAYRKEEELSVDAWIDQLSVHGREMPVKLTSMDHLSIPWLMQQNFPRIQIPVFDRLPSKWSEFVLKSKNLACDLQFLKSTRRSTYILQH